MDFVEKHLFEKWDFERMSYNKNLTLDFLGKYLIPPRKQFDNKDTFVNSYEKKYDEPLSWDWYTLCGDTLTPEFIDKYKGEIKRYGIKLRYDALSYNPNITLEFVQKNMDKDWDWCSLFKRFIL